MKVSSYNLLTKANIKGSKRSTSVFVLLLLSVLSLMLILSFVFMLNYITHGFKSNDWTRRFDIDSFFVDIGNKPIDETTLDEIKKIEHVLAVDKSEGMRYQFFDVQAITDNEGRNCNSMLPVGLEDSGIEAWSLYKSEKMEVVTGKNLDESPVFSCIIPNLFYPSNEVRDIYTENLSFQNGEGYIGKVITVKPYGGYYESLYCKKDSEGNYISDWLNLPALEYKLKVVGVYNATYNSEGNPGRVFVSNNTGQKIQEMALNALTNKEYIKDFKESQKDPAAHIYTVLVDTYENIGFVQDEITKMKVGVSITQQMIPDSVLLLSAIFTGAGNFFTFAILLLTVVNLFLSVSNNLMERKGEIGLLKAIGYKNRQIFFSMYFEQLKLSVRAFCIGAALSGAVVLIINLINGNGAFQNRMYVVQWADFALLAAFALGITVLVPLLCQLIILPRLTKIQPRQAMDAG